MKKAELALLERAFKAEINAALTGPSSVMQTRARLAEQLVAEGYLARHTVTMPGRPPVKVTGYVLTHAGRMAYCMTCADEPEPTR